MRLKTEAQRDAILDAATDVFREKGYDKASMNNVAQRVGGSKGTLYNYFSSKEELFAAAMLRAISASAMQAFNILKESAESDFTDQLVLFGNAYLKFILAPESLEITRLALNEGRSGKLGILLYKESVQKGWMWVADCMAERLNHHHVNKEGAWEIAMQYKSLLSAELTELLLRGVIREATSEQISKAAEKSAQIIMRLYAEE